MRNILQPSEMSNLRRAIRLYRKAYERYAAAEEKKDAHQARVFRSDWRRASYVDDLHSSLITLRMRWLEVRKWEKAILEICRSRLREPTTLQGLSYLLPPEDQEGQNSPSVAANGRLADPLAVDARIDGESEGSGESASDGDGEGGGGLAGSGGSGGEEAD